MIREAAFKTRRCFPVFCLLCAFFVVFANKAQAEHVLLAAVEEALEPIKVHDKNDILFRHLSVSQGLSQTRVSQILQDDEGYIWFGSQHGVSRYDGYAFRTFRHERANPGSLSGTFIYSLFKDKKGTIWVGSDQYLDAFDSGTELFRHYVIDPSSPTVIHISEGAEGKLWLSTSQGLFALDPESGDVTRYGHDPLDPNGLSSSDIKSTGFDRHGVFWVASGFGLEALDPATGKVSRRIPLRQEVREFGFHEDSHGTFWIYYGAGNGLAIYDRTTNVVRRLAYDEASSETSLSGVYSLIETSGGDIWLATMGSGLLKLNRGSFTFDRYLHNPSDQRSLAANRAIALREDREGNIWVGLHSAAPNMFPSERAPFERLWPLPKLPNKLGESLVNTILEDQEGYVWFGASGALNRLGPDRALTVHTPLGRDTPVEILTLLEGGDGKLWIGTLGAGLLAYDRETGEIASFRSEPGNDESISSDIVTRIYPAGESSFWISTWNGLNRFDIKSSKFQRYFRTNPAHSAFFSIASDLEGHLWLGSTKGLARFSTSTGHFETYINEPMNELSLSNNTVNSVIVDSEQVVWVGTQNGLNRIKPPYDRVESFFDIDGLPGNVVSCILEDEAGHLWMSTNKGVARLNPRDLSFSNFTTQDGLPGEDLTGWNACARSTNGSMYFAGFSGATVHRHTVPLSAKPAPNVVFSDISAGGRQIPTPRGNSAIAIDHSSDLRVTFAALSFLDPPSTRYRYRLNGLDADWHTVSSEGRTINYAHLPAGAYQLVVQAAVQRGSWTDEGALLNIVVHPPWWRSWWFVVLASLALVSAFALAFRARSAQLRNEYNIRLAERVGERSRVARELHDTLLQSFQGLSFQMQAMRHLLPSKPAQAISLLDSILDRSDQAISEGRDAIQALREAPPNVEIVKELRDEGERLARSISERLRPEFAVVALGDPSTLDEVELLELYRICQEAIRNAFRHSGATRIDCRLSITPGRTVAVVQDNGQGFERGGAVKSHFGLKGMEERARKIGATIAIETARGIGTRVSVTLKRNSWTIHTLRKRLRDLHPRMGPADTLGGPYE